MGVPKFFRYISERYPCLSEVVREYQIPEFDNMYLDMNGIIHNCSHPDDNNPHFRITEEKIFQDIFHYLEVLFRMIKPRKLFFMAIDGVAPRAKMNQQRGRRFRAAKDALKQEEDAKKKGEELPKESRFDSNCITPGTVFMAKLHEQLKYFVVDKISNDPLWKSCKIILSGHETPGEGEHKIMDYIRYIRSQPGYDPNTRHCLYGLDADLIMLGLCTHEPHFSLLREEVKFGKKSTKRESVPEEITFFLLHLSLMREYLELEFSPVRDKIQGFEYDFEKIIDDWVLMGFLVGNDFIPHLPNLHIANGALPILYKAYMDVLPTLDGYINEGGTLNLERFEKFMQKLSSIDLEKFEDIRDDMLYMEAKTGRKWKHGNGNENGGSEKNLIEFEFDEEVKPTDSGLEALIKNTEEMYFDSSGDDGDDDDDDDEEDRAFENYKKEYYRNKLDYANVTPEVMRAQAEGYVRAIQWNLNYYYNGVCSWSWYYPHHYSPYISDIKGFKDLKLDFDLGTPFLPYEQLLGVLPAASKTLLPEAYHELMTSEESPIKKYYPENFDTDLNGKKQEWEAVVLIPFMDEKLLLEAMGPCSQKLTAEESNRNKHGPMLAYTYTEKDLGKYEAPAYFAEVKRNHAAMQTLSIEDIRVPKEKLIKGAYPGVRMDVYYPGFPTMKHLKYEAGLMAAKVKVFEQPSRNESMIIRIISEEKDEDDVPTEWLGTNVFIGWPHLIEARVQAISNAKKKWINMGGPHHYNIEDRKQNIFKEEAGGIIERYRTRMGVEVGKVDVLVHVQVMTGRKYVFAPNGRLTLEKQFSELTANYPVQTVVADIEAYDSHHTTFRDITDVFPEGSICFTLSNPYYGSQGIVLNSKETLSKGRLKICVSVPEEPDFTYSKNLQADILRSYKTLYHVASTLSMSNNLFSRVTGSIFVTTRNREGEMKSVNIGLDLKFNKKNKETPGFTRKIGNTWYYTDKVADMVRDYTEKFPEVFEFFRQNDSYDNIMADDIFGKDLSDEKVKEVQQWLKTLPSHSVEKKICGSESADPEVVREIENVVDKLFGSKQITSKKVTMQVKPSLLYKPEIQSGTLVPDPKMTVQLFDRIVNTRVGYSVPFGLKGTITAICQSPTGSDRDTMYEVVFDKPFKDGMTLNCSDCRGYRLPKTSFINITYGKRLVEEKTGVTSSGNYTTAIDTGGKPQLGGKPLDPVWRRNFENQYSANRVQQPDKPEPSPYINLQEYHQSFKQYPYKPVFNNEPNSAFAQFANVFNQPPGAPNPNWKIPELLRKDAKGQQKQESASTTPRNENDICFVPHTGPKKEQTPKNETKKNGTLINTDMLHFVPDSGRKQEKQAHDDNVASTSNTQNNLNKENNVTHSERSISNSENSLLNLLNRNSHNVKLKKEETKENRRPMMVDTNFLKTILKIGDDKNKKENRDTSKPNQAQETCLNKSPNLDSQVSSNVSFEALAKVAQAPASVRLLTYYQSNELGVPRYQYIQSGSMYKAQITLIDGQVVLGEPQTTKEAATENVASQVLEMLINKAKSSKPKQLTNTTFPTPPKTWVETKTDQPTNVKKAEDIKQTPKVVNNPFVPLQAVKNQRKTSRNSQSESMGNNRNPSAHDDQSVKDSKNKSTNSTTNKPINNNKDKPKGQRKPRIAAKFSN